MPQRAAPSWQTTPPATHCTVVCALFTPSDWHLGQHFMGQSRQAEHAALIEWLLAQVTEHQVDAVLMVGDIFDTSAPPSYARTLYHHLIAGLQLAGVALLVLGGNHDAVSVLGESLPLLQHLEHHRDRGHGCAVQQHVVTLPRRADGAPGCIVCAPPFIRARDVNQPGWAKRARQATGPAKRHCIGSEAVPKICNSPLTNSFASTLKRGPPPRA